MTTYNGKAFIRECIESVLCQSYSNFEFLIIDDSSDDETVSIIQSYRDSRIKLHENMENIGQAASLNKGIILAKGDYIARLDQDDVCLVRRLEEQLLFLKKNIHVSLVCSYEHTIKEDGKYVRSWKSNIDGYGGFLGSILLGLCPVWHPSVMYRREKVIGLGLYEPKYSPAEDYQLWSKFALNKQQAQVIPQFHLLQRIHGQRQSILGREKQWSSTKQAHYESIKYFNASVAEDLADLLILDSKISKQIFNKKDFISLCIKLEKLLFEIAEKIDLNDIDKRSLHNTIYKRMGFGIKWCKYMSALPKSIFGIFVLLLSPRLNRVFLSSCKNYFCYFKQ